MAPIHPLLMRGSVAELRSKLSTPGGTLAPMWRHFQTLARREPQWFTPYTVLTALVTNEPCDRQRARETFARFVKLAPEAQGSNEAQFHTHVTAAQLGRWAIFYDWACEIELFSPQEDEAIRAALLDHAFVFPLQALQGRIRSFDNQILSNAFGVAAVGYVCGIKRGQSALGRRLFSSGLAWLHELLKRLPNGGWSGEGSTYQEHVVMPMVLMASLLVEETSGLDVLKNGIAPGPPALEVLQFTHDLIGPAGLFPAWDDHGFHAATVKSPLAFLARATCNPRPLATIRAAQMWGRTALPAWEADDRLWTLVWWPEELDDGQTRREYSPWMASGSAGALQSAKNNLRLFQYWDICGGLLQAGRLQTDPNAITLEAFNSPLLVDGCGQLSPELLPLPAAARDYVGARMLETVKEYRDQSLSDEDALRLALSGCIGYSNALIFDGETWFVPREPCVGNGEKLHHTGELQVLRSDATTFYTGRYGAQKVSRTSVLVRGEYSFVCDRVVCDAPHALTWQAFLRENAREENGRIVIETPEQVRCDIFPLQAGTTQLTPIAHYPSATVGSSVRLQHTIEPSADARLDFALVPQPLFELAQDLTGDWHFNFGSDAETVSIATAYLSDPATETHQPRRFKRNLHFAPNGKKVFIAVQQASRALEVRINGQAAQPTQRQQQGIWPEGATFLPHWFDVTEWMRAGENEIELIAPFFHGETIVGPVQLLLERAPLEVKVERTGDDSFSVLRGESRDEIIIERQKSAPWLDGSTDARHALRASDGTITALEVTHLDLPGVKLQSQPACDIVWNEDATVLSSPAMGARLEIVRAQNRLRVEHGGCLEIIYNGAQSHTLEIPWPHAGPVIINGQVQSTPESRSDGFITLNLAASNLAAKSRTATPQTVEEISVEEIYARAASGNCDMSAVILEALHADDWRLQIAAADLAGRLGLAEAAPILLQLFHASQAEWPYPALTQWWRWSKMNYRDKINGYDPDLPPAAIKRWRVRRAVVTALGILGDARAVTPLEAAMTRGEDFFPISSQLAVALGRLGAPSSISVLERHANHAEVNTRIHSRLALRLLRGETDRATFETKIGLQ